MLRQAALPLAISRRQLLGDFFREFRWTIIKSLPLGILLPMSLFFGSVGPDDFAKNYAGWARRFGLVEQAEWLSLYATGPLVLWSAIGVSVVYLIVAFIIPHLIRTDQNGRAAIAVPTLVGIIIAAALYGQYELIFAGSDRHLSENQRSNIKTDLSPTASKFSRAIVVMAAEANPEASGYAIEIMGALAQSGLKVASINTRMLQPFRLIAMDSTVRGVFFQVRDIKNIPEEVQLLQNALKDAGIKANFYYNPDLQQADYALSVGLK